MLGILLLIKINYRHIKLQSVRCYLITGIKTYSKNVGINVYNQQKKMLKFIVFIYIPLLHICNLYYREIPNNK